ncbi:TonB-dependent receptor [Fulvivirga sp. 29W222]|uniref:TonB-dependent receptor n=1 Tax=Fulvivirga marina TaxID=2494733 RepID=A0A937G2X6_9BACT|nr:TonB-dependent receptor [Fulvivirga marina]MBL6449707.1 TonB-dependent receptor [Fulvivirga marina]
MKQTLRFGVIVIAFFVMVSFSAIAQTGTVSGKVLDEANGDVLIGANVLVKGTTKGSVTDVNGGFKIGDVDAGSQTIVISFIGFAEKEIQVTVNEGQNTDIGNVQLGSSAIGLAEVQIIASVAVDRKTPVAVSTIKQAELEAKIGSQEFPEILKSTPGIYATKSGGGFGDGRVNIRGFNDENVAVLINGVPVNDMENGNVYWSNWAGLTDATRSMQVQRGLGASKVAVPSIGGTINIISKATDFEKGGNVYVATGNDAYSKIGFSLNSGLSENGWAFTLSGARTKGDGYVDGTEFLGYSYYANIAKQINDDHEVTFTAIGTKQRHGQRQSNSLLIDYEESPSGIKYNPDWGYKNGEVLHVEDNFYHKPQLSLNHYWTISDKAELSTAAYASFGTGGGGGTGGTFDKSVRTGGQYGPIDVDYFVEQNENTVDGNALAWLRASRNDHKWYGVLSSLKYDISSNLQFLGGLDFRYYKGSHFYEITDLLGGDYVLNNDDINNPNRILKKGDKYNYNYDGIVLWEGVFGQFEYTKDKLSTFLSLAASNTSYSRVENFKETPDNKDSEDVSFFGYQIKGGANYNLTRNHNIFANIGFFEKAPFFRNVFLSRTSNAANEDAVNEKIMSTEIGYGYREKDFTANINVYRTQWLDKASVRSLSNAGQIFYANITGIDALHQGVEVDAVYKGIKNFTFTGMLSVGDWRWQNNVQNVRIEDEDGNPLGDPINIFIDDLKVGDAAQTTAALGMKYSAGENITIGIDYNYYDNLYASFDPTSRTSENVADAWQVPAYGLFDLNLTYKLQLGNFNASIYGNVYNLADTEYVADANDGGDAANSRVYYGYGRNWNLGLKINF